MSVNPQFTFDNDGTPVGVFLSLNDWNIIAQKLNIEIPGWQNCIIDLRIQERCSLADIDENADDIFSGLTREESMQRKEGL